MSGRGLLEPDVQWERPERGSFVGTSAIRVRACAYSCRFQSSFLALSAFISG
jgi:hypothetical protein